MALRRGEKYTEVLYEGVGVTLSRSGLYRDSDERNSCHTFARGRQRNEKSNVKDEIRRLGTYYWYILEDHEIPIDRS